MFSRYQRFLLQGKGSQDVMLTIRLHLVLRLKMSETVPPYHICLHAVERDNLTFASNSLLSDLDIFMFCVKSIIFSSLLGEKGGWVFFMPTCISIADYE